MFLWGLHPVYYQILLYNIFDRMKLIYLNSLCFYSIIFLLWTVNFILFSDCNYLSDSYVLTDSFLCSSGAYGLLVFGYYSLSYVIWSSLLLVLVPASLLSDCLVHIAYYCLYMFKIHFNNLCIILFPFHMLVFLYYHLSIIFHQKFS